MQPNIKEKIIIELIQWIEDNLEKPLSIDIVAQKSGYSKWHLQRMFKQMTNQVLATYIRLRRLTHCAISLKLTSRPILEIAMRYQFDSQQTFTRTFKKQFGVTPAQYRRIDTWDQKGLMPFILFNNSIPPTPAIKPEIIYLPPSVRKGITYRNNCSLNEIEQKKLALRKEFAHLYLEDLLKERNEPLVLYCYSNYEKDKEHADMQEVYYSVTMDEESKIKNTTPYYFNGGQYAKFQFKGPAKALNSFIKEVLFYHLPAQSLTLRKCEFIEIYSVPNGLKTVDDILQSEELGLEYYIPIMNETPL